MAKMPAMQWYPADWRKDLAVQALGYHDRGVWFEMLCLMHESSERGVLLLNGAPMADEVVARLLGLDKQTFEQTLATLLTYGVAKRRQGDNATYSKRMVEDEKLCQIRREAGKLGGNPALLKQKQATGDKQNPTPSSSSSPSSSIEDQLPMSSGDDVRQCPTGTLVNLYHDLMPLNPRVKTLNAARKSAIKARWIEASKLDCEPFGYQTTAAGVEAWRQFFAVCAESKFLTGLAPPGPGKPAFIADIDFLFSPSGFTKTLENKYHRDTP